MSQTRIDRYLADIRGHNFRIESLDREIAATVAVRNEEKAAVAERLGRIAFLEGKKKGRNPCHPPLSRNWNIGYEAERAETVEACRSEE